MQNERITPTAFQPHLLSCLLMISVKIGKYVKLHHEDSRSGADFSTVWAV